LVEELEKPYPHVAEGLLCQGWREATNRGAVWYAIHVEAPQQSLQKISTSNFRALLDNVNLATDLEAELVWLKSSDVIEAILEFAREKAISKIILKRSPWLLGTALSSFDSEPTISRSARCRRRVRERRHDQYQAASAQGRSGVTFNFELLSRRAMVFTLAENVVDVCRESDKTQQILVEYRRTDSGVTTSVHM
jgi:L-lactate utilization protein LutC